MTLDLEPALVVLAADGVDLTLVDVEGGVAHLRLGILDATCAQCVLPRSGSQNPSPDRACIHRHK